MENAGRRALTRRVPASGATAAYANGVAIEHVARTLLWAEFD
jgi:hypothetical protein